LAKKGARNRKKPDAAAVETAAGLSAGTLTLQGQTWSAGGKRGEKTSLAA